MPLASLLDGGSVVFCFLLCVGPSGCSCGLNPKSIKEVSILMRNYQKFYSPISLSKFLGIWLQDRTSRFIEKDVINEMLISTDSSYQ